MPLVDMLVTGPGTDAEWSANSGTVTAAVQTSDGDSLYITGSVDPSYQGFAIAALPAGPAIVNAVYVYAVAKAVSPFYQPHLAGFLRIAGNRSRSAEQLLTGGYRAYTYGGADGGVIITGSIVRPGGGPWVIADLTAGTLEAGVVITGDPHYHSYQVRVTYLKVIADVGDSALSVAGPSQAFLAG